MSPNPIGQVLLNQFRVDAFVASGGMGAVYRVWDLKRNVPLAMKVLHAELAEDPVVFKRFQREANALKKLAHPNIVPFYGLYQTRSFAFLLERFIDGPSLKDILHERQGSGISTSDQLAYLKALCAALGYAHANGVVHCDVKPGNVMVDRGGNIYLTDFGIARHSESTTTTMGAGGTPAYMAPEQIRGEAVSPATDIYALGVMLFEMLAGQRPFRGTEVGTEKGGTTANERIRYGQLMLEPPDLRTLNPNIPPGLSQVVKKALNKRPQDRYQSTASLFNAVCEAAGGIPEEVKDRAVVPELSAQHEYTAGDVLIPPAPVGGRDEPPKGSRGLKWGLGLAGILVIGCVVLAAAGIGINALIKAKPASTATVAAPTITFKPSSNGQTDVLMTAAAPPADTAAVPTFTATLLWDNKVTTISAQDGMVLVYVPAGEFLMGANKTDPNVRANETPIHTVTLDGFWIDRTEVTNSMFAKFVEDKGYTTLAEKMGSGTALGSNGGWIQDKAGVNWRHPHDPSDDISGLGNRPVVQVSWDDADAYCKWALRHLPTEAEWEKAARGADSNLYPWGMAEPNADLLNFNKIVGHLTDVDNYPKGASPYGVLDMLGNAYEWVFDWYGSNYYSNSPVSNPLGPNSGTTRVMRGGAWNYGLDYTRTTSRSSIVPTYRGETMGFRCALSDNP